MQSLSTVDTITYTRIGIEQVFMMTGNHRWKAKEPAILTGQLWLYIPVWIVQLITGNQGSTRKKEEKERNKNYASSKKLLTSIKGKGINQGSTITGNQDLRFKVQP